MPERIQRRRTRRVAVAAIDRFSSLDDIPAKLRGNTQVVLRTLARTKCFYCFEVDDRLGSALGVIRDMRWATFDTESIGYPWTLVTLTEAGRAALANAPTCEAEDGR